MFGLNYISDDMKTLTNPLGDFVKQDTDGRWAVSVNGHIDFTECLDEAIDRYGEMVVTYR